MSENCSSDSSEFNKSRNNENLLFQKESEHIQNISEKIEPTTNLKHARIIAQPLQRNSSVSLIKKKNYFFLFF